MKKKILIIAGSVLVVVVVAVAILAMNLNKIINSRKGALLAQAKQVQGQYSGQIHQKAQSLDATQVMKMVKE